MTRKRAIKIIMSVTHCGNRRWVNKAFDTVKKHIAGNPSNVDVCFRVLYYLPAPIRGGFTILSTEKQKSDS